MEAPAQNQKQAPIAITITMEPDLIAYLDDLSTKIRKKSGAAISRSGLIRGIIRGIQPLDLTPCRTEPHIEGCVTFVLKSYLNNKRV